MEPDEGLRGDDDDGGDVEQAIRDEVVEIFFGDLHGWKIWWCNP